MESSLRITGYLLQRKEPIRFGQPTEHSEWISVKALPEKALTTLKISDDTKPATLESFIFKDKGTPDIIDLSKLTVKAFDQYDGEWNDLSDVKWHIDFDYWK